MENSDDLVPIIIDLGVNRKNELNESWLSMFGGAIEMILGRMFGNATPPVKIKGTRREIDSFSRAIGKEKRYMDTAMKHGLTDPRTYKNKYELEKAIANFERTTGVKWPFK